MYSRVFCLFVFLCSFAALAADPLSREQMGDLEALFGSYERALHVAEEIAKRNDQFAQKEVVRVLNEIKLPELRPSKREDAIGVVILVDRSLSMNDSPKRESQTKIDTARSAMEALLEQLQKAASSNNKNVRAGVLAFDGRVKELMPMTDMKHYKLNNVGEKLDTFGASGTAIGTALVAGQKTLARAKLKRNHIVILTDGESNQGVAPHLALQAFQFLTSEEFPVVHFVAFDIDRDVFRPLNRYLYKISEARDSKQLNAVLDIIVRQEILAENPNE